MDQNFKITLFLHNNSMIHNNVRTQITFKITRVPKIKQVYINKADSWYDEKGNSEVEGKTKFYIQTCVILF